MAKTKKQGAKREIAKSSTGELATSGLVDELRDLIHQARTNVAQSVNTALVNLYWQIGTRIRSEVLKNERAEYGKQIVQTLSAQLAQEFGNGFSRRNLFNMLQFAEYFPDSQIVVTLSRQLSWSHFVAILPLKDPLQREFYAEMCRVENWSVRTLRSKINGMLFERTALSKKPTELARQELAELQENDQLTPDLVFRDPYFLDFLQLKDTYNEQDLESAILRELESFILELGTGFAFVGRQVRITIDGRDHYIDLVFYHRRLKRLVAIDLKLGEFKAAYKGQMELYLRWLERHEMQPGEDAPLGLILCADKSAETIELLRVSETGIRVASYLTELPPIEILRKKLHDAVLRAQQLLDHRGDNEQ